MSNKPAHYAYGPERVEIEAVMRFGAVKRWHMIDTTRTQNLAEHSACVAALVYGIATNSDGFFEDPYRIAVGALMHDMSEVFTGDVPSHTKKRLMGLDDLEIEVTPSIWDMLGVTDNLKDLLLIKLCDLADGIRFIRLHGVDVTALHAREGLERQLAARIADTHEQKWPDHIQKLTREWIFFYAYEQS